MISWLILLGIVIFFAASLIITTLRVSIPPMPSSPAVRGLMLSLLKDCRCNGPIIELGSGWGGLSRQAARAFPLFPVKGVEVSLIPFLFSWLVWKIGRQHNLELVKKDILKIPIEPETAYLCYLSPAIMEKLSDRLTGPSAQGAIIVSAVFALPGRQPLEIREVKDLYRSKVYLYRL